MIKKKDIMKAMEEAYDGWLEKVNAPKECSMCGKCCSNGLVSVITQEDVDREPDLHNHIRQTTAMEHYKFHSDWKVEYQDGKCHYYDTSIGCTIHETKPNSCRQRTPSIAGCASCDREIQRRLIMTFPDVSDIDTDKSVEQNVQKYLDRIDQITLLHTPVV